MTLPLSFIRHYNPTFSDRQTWFFLTQQGQGQGQGQTDNSCVSDVNFAVGGETSFCCSGSYSCCGNSNAVLQPLQILHLHPPSSQRRRPSRCDGGRPPWFYFLVSSPFDSISRDYGVLNSSCLYDSLPQPHTDWWLFWFWFFFVSEKKTAV